MAEPHDPSASRAPGRGPLLLGSVAVIAVVAVIAGFTFTRGSDDGADHGGCLRELAHHLAPGQNFVEGANLVAARASGYDDSSTESMIDSSIETAISPDPLVTRTVLQQYDLEAELPYDPADVECWLGVHNDFVASGSFDPTRVRDTQPRLGEIHVSAEGDLIATDTAYLTPTDTDGLLTDAVAMLGSDVLAVRALTGLVDGEVGGSWFAMGLVPAGSGNWAVALAWAFEDPEIAAEAEPLLRQVIAEESRLPELVQGDPSNALEREGNVLRLSAPMDKEPPAWIQFLNMLDAVLLFDPYAAD